MYTLDAVHPITHAVGNTIKRVILILFSVVRFGTPMTQQRCGHVHAGMGSGAC